MQLKSSCKLKLNVIHLNYMRISERRRQFFKSFEAKSLRQRSLLTQISDDLTEICGSTSFLLFHLIYIGFWIAINLGYLPQIEIFDPFPFGLLTMVLSIEAIFLAIFILVSQNRSSYVNTIRDEVHMRVNLIAEEEITKVLQLLAEIRRDMGIKKEDPQLSEMLERINTNYIERSVLEELQRANTPLATKLGKEFPDILTAPIKAPMEVIHYIDKLAEEGEELVQKKVK